MDNLPIELIHLISNQLNYFDQINFKSTSQWFYKHELLNRHLPGVVIIRQPKGLDYDHCIKNNVRYSSLILSTPLSSLKNTLRNHYNDWIINRKSLDIYIQRRTNVNQGGSLYVNNCDRKPDFMLKAVYKKIYFDCKPLNYKICIQTCADIVRQDMFDNNLIEY